MFQIQMLMALIAAIGEAKRGLSDPETCAVVQRKMMELLRAVYGVEVAGAWTEFCAVQAASEVLVAEAQAEYEQVCAIDPEYRVEQDGKLIHHGKLTWPAQQKLDEVRSKTNVSVEEARQRFIVTLAGRLPEKVQSAVQAAVGAVLPYVDIVKGYLAHPGQVQ